MRKNISHLILLTLIFVFAIPSILAFAGSKNQNGDNGTQGTDKLNGLDGCRPGLQSGNYWVYVPSDVLDQFGFTDPYFHKWEGGPCCPTKTLSEVGSQYPLPNQCCNGPDYLPDALGGAPTGEQAPGNHCLCFEIRGYPFRLLPPFP